MVTLGYVSQLDYSDIKKAFEDWAGEMAERLGVLAKQLQGLWFKSQHPSKNLDTVLCVPFSLKSVKIETRELLGLPGYQPRQKGQLISNRNGNQNDLEM